MLVDHGAEWEKDVLQEYYRELLTSAEGEVDLLYSLLNWAQVQTRKIPFHPDSFDVVEATHSEIIAVGNMAKQKNIELIVRLPDHHIITGDRNMLTTVVRNLLTNAVKFTHENGKIEFEISPSDKGCVISVSDNGMGMNSEQLQNLYCIDKQHSRKGTAGEKGSGLGLIVTKEFIEKHGSTLHIESETGRGSRFWFEIIS